MAGAMRCNVMHDMHILEVSRGSGPGSGSAEDLPGVDLCFGPGPAEEEMFQYSIIRRIITEVQEGDGPGSALLALIIGCRRRRLLLLLLLHLQRLHVPLPLRHPHSILPFRNSPIALSRKLRLGFFRLIARIL